MFEIDLLSSSLKNLVAALNACGSVVLMLIRFSMFLIF